METFVNGGVVAFVMGQSRPMLTRARSSDKDEVALFHFTRCPDVRSPRMFNFR